MSISSQRLTSVLYKDSVLSMPSCVASIVHISAWKSVRVIFQFCGLRTFSQRAHWERKLVCKYVQGVQVCMCDCIWCCVSTHSPTQMSHVYEHLQQAAVIGARYAWEGDHRVRTKTFFQCAPSPVQEKQKMFKNSHSTGKNAESLYDLHAET